MFDGRISAKRAYSTFCSAKKNHRAASLIEVAALLFVLSAVVLAGYALDLNQEVSKGPGEAGEQVTAKPLGAAFLRDTKVGRVIGAYLGCIDFDCLEKSQAVVALGQDAVPPLLQVLQHGVTPAVAVELPGDVPLLVRLRAIQALGALGDSRAANALVNAIQDSNPIVRAEAAAALGRFSGEDMVLTALLSLLEDPDPLVREMTVSALKKLERPEALSELRRALDNELQTHIRSAIEKTIQALERR